MSIIRKVSTGAARSVRAFLMITLLIVHSSIVLSAWERTDTNPLFSPGNAGSFDSSGITDSNVIQVGSSFRMYYSAHSSDTGSTIAMAESQDGLSWTRYGIVFDRGNPGFFDSEAVKDPCVIEDNGGFRMWYAGYDGSNWRIGQAFSPNGISWMRIIGTDFSGASFALHSTPDRFDHMSAEAPFVVRIGNSYRMVYEGYIDPRRTYIGSAISNDGNVWLKVDGPGDFASSLDPGPHGFDDNGVGSPHLIFDTDKQVYRLFYDCVHYCVLRPINSIGYATSTDGLSWSRHGPILGRSYYVTFDALDVFDPSVLHVQDKYLLYYTGSNDRTFAIGRAEAGAIDIKFDPERLDFPDTLVPTSTTSPVRFVNAGAEAVTMQSLTSSQPEFVWVDEPEMPLKLHPNEHIDLNVRFNPSGLEYYESIANALVSESPHPLELTLSGRGNRVAVHVDRSQFITGDPMHAKLSIKGPTHADDLDLYLVFEAFGAFYSFPDWSPGFHPIRFPVGPDFLLEEFEFFTMDLVPEVPDGEYAFWAAVIERSTGLSAVSVDRFSVQIHDRLTTAKELDQWRIDHPDAIVLDVRTDTEFCPRHLPGAINIPHDAFAEGASAALSNDTEYIVVCSNGIRSRYVIDILLAEGFRNLWYLKDGLSLYSGPYVGCR